MTGREAAAAVAVILKQGGEEGHRVECTFVTLGTVTHSLTISPGLRVQETQELWKRRRERGKKMRQNEGRVDHYVELPIYKTL